MAGGGSAFLPGEKPGVKGRTYLWRSSGNRGRLGLLVCEVGRPCPPCPSTGLHEEPRGKGDGGERALGPAVGLELGPHVSPQMANSCSQHGRQAGVVSGDWGRSGPQRPLRQAPPPPSWAETLIFLSQNLRCILEGGDACLPLRALPEASVTPFGKRLGQSPGQAWSIPGLDPLCEHVGALGCACPPPPPTPLPSASHPTVNAGKPGARGCCGCQPRAWAEGALGMSCQGGLRPPAWPPGCPQCPSSFPLQRSPRFPSHLMLSTAKAGRSFEAWLRPPRPSRVPESCVLDAPQDWQNLPLPRTLDNPVALLRAAVCFQH